jgi:hypothetical protein
MWHIVGARPRALARPIVRKPVDADSLGMSVDRVPQIECPLPEKWTGPFMRQRGHQ